MPTLTREDGAVFTVANYRSTVLISKPSIMKSELRFLAEQHGNHVCIVRLNEFETEGVFSQDPGYPIGELVWDYFDRPSSLLYLEALTKDNKDKSLMVVVREGRVFLDAVIENNLLEDEFVSLVAENIPMDIKLFGDVPLAQKASEGKFAFPKELVNSFTECDHSALEELKPDPAFELLPPNEALARSAVLPKNMAPIFLALAIVFGLGGYYLYQGLTKEEVKVVQRVIRVDPFADYLSDLRQPPLEDQFTFLNESLEKVYGIAHWRPEKIIYAPPAVLVDIKPAIVTDIKSLNLWSKVNNIPFEIDNKDVRIRFNDNLQAREKPEHIYPLSDMLSDLMNSVVSSVPLSNIEVGSPIVSRSYRTVRMTITLNNASPAILEVLGNIFYDKPAVLRQAEFSVEQSGTITGKIEINLLGK